MAGRKPKPTAVKPVG
ncbi:hypothetical protein ERE_03740 [Agathobacter rectalis M104/1]|nr:hypothetical protein ERE_03740 [Agathobacter rectalis M104/1]